MSVYSRQFTLSDIFSNKELRAKLPYIQYKETEKEDGKISVRTKMLSISAFTYDVSKKSARPYYNPFVPRKNGNNIVIKGVLNEGYQLGQVVDDIYTELLAKRMIIQWTANNMGIIRKALKEGKKTQRIEGKEPKLALKISSIDQIKFMNNSQITYFIDDVMKNIVYGDDFPQTQNKYNVEKLIPKNVDYQTAVERWNQNTGV